MKMLFMKIDDEYGFGYIKVDIKGIKPPQGTNVWVGVWVDSAYGDSTFSAYSRNDIVKLSIKQFFIDYPQARCLNFSILKCRNCLSTHHPYDDDDEDESVHLVFKKVTV